MKKFNMLRASLVFLSIMGVFTLLTGCSGDSDGILGGGSWFKPDATKPTVTLTSPINRATGVPVNSKISAVFSTAMSPSSINGSTFTLQQGTTVVPGSVSYSGVTAVFAPTSALDANTEYTATITTGAKDSADSSLANNYVWRFTTGAAPDNTNPTISFTAPINGAINVPFNQKINVAFSEVMDPLTLNTTTFTVTAAPGAVPVPGVVTSVGSTVMFVPLNNLAASTIYTANISTAAKDLAGNPLAADYSWSFTTGAAAETTKPTVSITSPTTTAVAVPTSRSVTVGFSEVMDSLTLTTTTFKLTGPGVTPVTGVVTSVGTTATFVPANNLAPNTLYTGTITTGVADLAGNTLANDFVFTFTTGVAADSARPTVSFTAPVNNAVNVPLNQRINLAFSEAMDPLSLTTATFKLTGPGVTPVTGIVTPVGATATFVPASNLSPGILYTATVTTGAKDLAGNALASDFTFTFTTGAAAETTSPTVSITSPTNTAVAVPVNRKVTVGFSEVMDPLTLTTVSFKLTGPGVTPVTGVVTSVGATATFVPASNLVPNTLYTGTITTGAADLAGNTLANEFTFTFRTALVVDITRPTVISTIPVDLAVGVGVNNAVTAIFSEDMDPLTVVTETVALKETVSGNNVPATVIYNAGSRTVTLRPLSNLANNTNYTATIKSGSLGVKDLAGNEMAVDKVWSFTTSAALDITSPTVTLVNPLDLATNVSLNSTVSATFSEDMDPLTISTASFSVAGVTGIVSFDAINRIATFTPASNLAPSTTYTATVTTGVKDLAGNSMALNKVWSFTTGTGLAPGSVALGSVSTFGIMATAAITNTGFSTINGDVSLEPGTSMTGFPPGVVNGAIHINDTVSAQARADLLIAYNFAKTLPPGTTISGGADLGALYPLGIPPGTYTSGSTMMVSTPLTLDAGGNANAVWIFQVGSSFTTTASVTLANGAQAKNVFWVPTEDGTIGVGTIFHGNIISGRSVTGVTGATINGRILAGAITGGTIALDTNTVNVPAP